MKIHGFTTSTNLKHNSGRRCPVSGPAEFNKNPLTSQKLLSVETEPCLNYFCASCGAFRRSQK